MSKSTLSFTVAIVIAAVFACLVPGTYAERPSDEVLRQYPGYGARREGALNVHLVCHTHDDVGWLKTVDQYYVGSNNSIQHAGVEYILDSVIMYLSENPNRKFDYVEQAFFQRWWRQQTLNTKNKVKQLISRGQLQFTNGGYCMHDEAATHFMGMIDQTTLGHRLLLENLDYRVRTGWQIDPFGHSSTQASLLSSEAGFEALYFARMDYQDRKLRYNRSELEFMWRASPSLGEATQIFTGQFIAGHYEAPSSFCFDQRCADPTIQDDRNLYDYNVKERVNTFVNMMYEYFAHSKGEDIMLTMGTDFGYENANTWFKNLDKLIKYVNQDGRVNVFYSTVQEYTDAKLKAARKQVESALKNKDLVTARANAWTVKTDDFFPYSDCPHCMWTGYFTSRASLKRAIREGDAYLQVVKQLDSLFNLYPNLLGDFEEAMAIAQHHDAATGTSRQHVAYDYMRRIYAGRARGAEAVNDYIMRIAKHAEPHNNMKQLPEADALKKVTLSAKSYWCPLLNQTICKFSTEYPYFAINLYNALGRTRSELVRIPVSTPYVNVRDPQGRRVPIDVLDTWTVPGAEAAGEDKPAPYTLYFQATVPPMGLATYFVEPSDTSRLVRPLTYDVNPSGSDEPLTLISDSIRLRISLQTGLPVELTELKTKKKYAFTQDVAWYTSYVKDNEQNSGAYIFRPASNVATNVAQPSRIVLYEGRLVTEARQVYPDDTNWIGQNFRLPMFDSSGDTGGELDVDFSVGPIPIDDKLGKEVVLRYNVTGLRTQGRIYTDSNAREFLERRRDFRPTWPLEVFEPISGNYYPVSQAAYMRDAVSDDAFGILTDRNQAGGSIADGSMEFMVHRRTLADDARGVDEPLNETQAITPGDWKRIGPGIRIAGTHKLVFNSSTENAIQAVRQRIGTTFHPFWLSFGPLQNANEIEDYIKYYRTSYSLLSTDDKVYDLPPNVEVLTAQPWIRAQFMIRVAHNYAKGEHTKLSEPVTVDLAPLLDRLLLKTGAEYSLTGTFTIQELRERRQQLRAFTLEEDGHMAETGISDEEVYVDKQELEEEQTRLAFATTHSFPVTLGPMKIRTFLLLRN